MTRKRQEQFLWEASSRITPPTPPDITNAWKRLHNSIVAREHGVDRRAEIRWFGWLSPKLAFALGIAVLFLGMGWLVTVRLSARSFQTGRGEQQTLVLPDSSSVRLNQNSVLTFRRGLLNEVRLVNLSGEAYFSVRSDEGPFIIATAVGSIRVVGTEFNVSCKNERLEVAVNKGVVEVSATSNGVDSTVRVRKGEIVVCRSGKYPEGPRPIRFDQYPGWLSGRLLLDQIPVPVICKEIEEMTGVTVHLADSSLADVTITGILEGHDANVLVATLCSLTGRHFRYEHDGYVIY